MPSLTNALLGVALLPAVWAVGCPNCLGYDRTVIATTCKTACADPDYGFTDPDQITNCEQYCDTFTNIQNCCNSATCPSDPFTCTHPQSLVSRDINQTDTAEIEELEKIRRDPSTLDISRLISRDSPYHLLKSTEEVRALDPRSLALWQLEGSPPSGKLQRRGAADICCKVAKGMALGAGAMLPTAMGSQDDFQSFVILMVISMAAAQTCGKLFSMICNPYVLLASAIASVDVFLDSQCKLIPEVHLLLRQRRRLVADDFTIMDGTRG